MAAMIIMHSGGSENFQTGFELDIESSSNSW